MSDNIWFLGDVVCSRKSASTDNLHQSAFSLQDIAKMWSRVAQFGCFTDLTWKDASSNIFSVSSGLNELTGPTRELDTLDPTKNQSYSFNVAGAVGGAAGAIDILDSSGGDAIIVNGGSFYPLFSAGFEWGIAATADGIVLQSYPGPPVTSPPVSLHSTVTGTVMGYNWPFYLYVQSAVTSITFTSISFDPVAFWPYASRKDGTPIYDSLTGALLQDPTN